MVSAGGLRAVSVPYPLAVIVAGRRSEAAIERSDQEDLLLDEVASALRKKIRRIVDCRISY